MGNEGKEPQSKKSKKPSSLNPKKTVTTKWPKESAGGRSSGRSDESKAHRQLKSQFVSSLKDGLSDISLSEDEELLQAELKPKKEKNRMGQRARRQLWERQFGKNANHVKKQLMESRNEAKKPSSQGNAARLPAKKDSGLHPSWQAKQKERGIKEFAGKKITF
ncbi:hypothetical protein HK101_009409 [Irineochytrium annulatum]|nr:hypothetical protein HK101_009409 [Irineochytrium annulatum]